jgi:hypothetical protein
MKDFCYRCGYCGEKGDDYEVEVRVYKDSEEEYNENKNLCPSCKDIILEKFQEEVEPSEE